MNFTLYSQRSLCARRHSVFRLQLSLRYSNPRFPICRLRGRHSSGSLPPIRVRAGILTKMSCVGRPIRPFCSRKSAAAGVFSPPGAAPTRRGFLFGCSTSDDPTHRWINAQTFCIVDYLHNQPTVHRPPVAPWPTSYAACSCLDGIQTTGCSPSQSNGTLRPVHERRATLRRW